MTWPTVLALLNFDLDVENRENQELELNAFYTLRKQDVAVLRELVVRKKEEARQKKRLFILAKQHRFVYNKIWKTKDTRRVEVCSTGKTDV